MSRTGATARPSRPPATAAGPPSTASAGSRSTARLPRGPRTRASGPPRRTKRLASGKQKTRKALPDSVLLPVLEVLLELPEGEAVDHATLLDPGPPRLRDAVLHEAKGPLVVGVCVDGYIHACSHGLADVRNREVETVNVGVEFEGRVRSGCL